MIVPGSPLLIDHPNSWYATVRHRVTGKESTYWVNGSMLTREDVAAWVARYFPHVEAARIEPAVGPPQKILAPIPPDHFEHGIRKAAEAELAETGNAGRIDLFPLSRPLAAKPSPRPIDRRPIVRR